MASTPSWATTTSFRILFFRKARSVSASSSGLSSTSNMVLRSIAVVPLRECSRLQGEIKRSAAFHGAFGPHLSAMAVNDPLYGSQTDPGPRELGGRVKPLERSEKEIHVARVESRSIIFHEIGAVAVLIGSSELDSRAIVRGRVLPCVAD